MPGFAAAKPGTGQTARAIIAPAPRGFLRINLQKDKKCITICNTGGGKMLTLRLSSDMEEKLNNIAEMLGIPKSEIVRKSLKAYLKQLEQNNAWTAGKSLFGKYSSGKSNLSENRKAILKQKLQDKRNAKNSN